MDKKKEFAKSVSTVMNEVSNCGFNVTCKPNIHNEKALTVIVYKKTPVKVTIKTNGTIRMRFDKQLSIGKNFTKTPSGSKKSALAYGYKERDLFPIDFRQI